MSGLGFVANKAWAFRTSSLRYYLLKNRTKCTTIIPVLQEIKSVSELSLDYGSGFVRTAGPCLAFSGTAPRLILGRYMELSLEGLQGKRIKPFDWAPAKFFAFISANAKGRNRSHPGFRV